MPDPRIPPEVVLLDNTVVLRIVDADSNQSIEIRVLSAESVPVEVRLGFDQTSSVEPHEGLYLHQVGDVQVVGPKELPPIDRNQKCDTYWIGHVAKRSPLPDNRGLAGEE